MGNSFVSGEVRLALKQLADMRHGVYVEICLLFSQRGVSASYREGFQPTNFSKHTHERKNVRDVPPSPTPIHRTCSLCLVKGVILPVEDPHPSWN